MQNTHTRTQSISSSETPVPLLQKDGWPRIGRRSFLRRLGWGGTALLPISSWFTSSANARDDSEGGGGLSHGDEAILRFLAAVEYLETDFWQQYTDLALGNAAYQQALQVLDGDMPTYQPRPGSRSDYRSRPECGPHYRSAQIRSPDDYGRPGPPSPSELGSGQI